MSRRRSHPSIYCSQSAVLYTIPSGTFTMAQPAVMLTAPARMPAEKEGAERCSAMWRLKQNRGAADQPDHE